MHTLIKHRDDFYTVGFAAADFNKDYNIISGWYPIEDCESKEEAIKLVNKLNGGSSD